MDDIFKDKEGITYKKAFGGLSSKTCLLIEGRPGSGKTTLVHKFSQDWAKREITITHVRLLFLIHLRGFCNDPNIGLSDLIGCYFSGSDVEVIEKYANKHGGLGLCFVLDGLDEYMPQRKNTYIYELIRKNFLSKSVVIVASRPAAAADFRIGATRQIEVLGFLRDQIYDYIEKYPFSKLHAGLIKYLDEHPNVLHMCYLPIHTCMVCFLYDNLESDLPQTETSIYAEFTKFTMLRMLYRDNGNSGMCIESLTDLPVPQNQLYNTICKLAFKMTSSSKQVMTQTELKQFFNLQPTDKDCMGLITIDKKAMMCGFQNIYTFLHLTFQEFLAAFYISSLDEEKQLELIEQFGDAIQMKQVWKFYCGLVPFTHTVISQSCHDTPFKVQCSFESQQPCTCDSVVDKNSLMFSNHFFTSSDFTAIAYVISNAQHQCVRKVVFDKCTICVEGVEILAQKACGKLSGITILCYHGYDSVTEQLLVVLKLMHSLPCLEILDVSNTNLGLDALNVNHPNLQILKVGSLGNSLYSSRNLPVLAKIFSSSCSKLVNMCKLIRPIKLEVLSDDLMHNHNCIELHLSWCGIDDDTVSILVDCLTHCTNLEILDLSCNRIGDKGAVSLAEGIKLAQRLEKLNLSMNNISDVGALAVVNATKCLVYLCGNSITNINDILQHVSGNTVDFHTLTFRGCGIGDGDAESLLQESNSKALCELFTKYVRCELSTKYVRCYSSVHVLDISSNYMSYRGAIALSSCLKYFPYLEELHISSNDRGIGPQGAIAIASALVDNIDIHSSGTKAIHLTKALAKPFNLTKLDISCNNIGCEGCKAISDVLNHCTHLEELNISGNDIGDDGACVLTRTFCHYAQCLLKLDISYNNIRSDGANAIADALKHCTHLEELNISHISGGACTSIVTSFSYYTQCLLKLDISHNSIRSDHVVAIADALKHTHLKELNISSIGAWDVEACTIVRSCSRHLQSLHTLDMSNNYIGNEGCRAMAESLKSCVNLRVLDLSYNFIDDFVDLDRALMHCTVII